MISNSGRSSRQDDLIEIQMNIFVQVLNTFWCVWATVNQLSVPIKVSFVIQTTQRHCNLVAILELHVPDFGNSVLHIICSLSKSIVICELWLLEKFNFQLITTLTLCAPDGIVVDSGHVIHDCNDADVSFFIMLPIIGFLGVVQA